MSGGKLGINHMDVGLMLLSLYGHKRKPLDMTKKTMTIFVIVYALSR